MSAAVAARPGSGCRVPGTCADAAWPGAGAGAGAGPGRPLALGRDARARLGGAVRALLDTPVLDGVPDAVRLAVLVLASRTPSETGVVVIRTEELAR
ncbi:hypothetical protein [Streptomyces clavuligerus]|uniref:hypothetical protein n=1 Tax=Streptomyces clavuligerus TaxID=1901 RepID=UPI0003006191|nr:hypothetical protein [Streptomyces clavuligerus]WDN56356.1 hypothetical protein LL058_31385 [Streptomyces clavuligerus]